MEDLAIAAGLVLGVVCWWWLVRCMRINGRPWWWRHLAGLLLANFAMAGLSMLLASLLGVADESGEPLGAVGAFGGLVVALPMLIPLAVSWRAARRAPSHELPASPEPTRAEPAREPGPKPEPMPMAEPEPEPMPMAEPEPKPIPAPEPAPTSVSKPGPEPASAPIKSRETWSAPYPVALRFTYRDSRGDVSTRELSNWRVSDLRLRGFDLDREAPRTFRLDRVVEVLEGADSLAAARQRPAQEGPEPEPDRRRQGAPEIHFSGFDAQTKRSLERTAEAHGFKVRKSVTKNLDFFCRGARPSQDKLAKAEVKPGCTVIDKDGFLWVVATGEIPA